MSFKSEVRQGVANTPEGRVHFLCAGQGQPLILLPHGGRSSDMYRGVLPMLAAHTRVVALDPPGAGGSFRPASPRSIPQLAETLHMAAVEAAGARYMLYGMNGGNKLGTAMAAAHPESIDGFIFAGLTHSIVLSNSRRAQTLGDHPAVRVLLEDRADGDSYRRDFYRAVLAYDLESALRSLTVPLAVLEFATPQEDTLIGRQGMGLARELGAAAYCAIELAADSPVSLEDRPDDLAAAILDLVSALALPHRHQPDH